MPGSCDEVSHLRSVHSSSQDGGEGEQPRFLTFLPQPRQTAQLDAPKPTQSSPKAVPPLQQRVQRAWPPPWSTLKMRCCREGSTSSISFQPWLLPNSCSLFIYFHISLVTQAAAHRFNPCTAWATLPGAVTAQGRATKAVTSSLVTAPALLSCWEQALPPSQTLQELGNPSALPGAGCAGQAAIPAVFVSAMHTRLCPSPLEHSPPRGFWGRGCPAPGATNSPGRAFQGPSGRSLCAFSFLPFCSSSSVCVLAHEAQPDPLAPLHQGGVKTPFACSPRAGVGFSAAQPVPIAFPASSLPLPFSSWLPPAPAEN